jgi:hypothetical protein
MTYLSIDLDYWTSRFPWKFLNHLASLKLPMVGVIDHHMMLDHINYFEPPKIINIDFHSDICEKYYEGDFVELECGTWANHVCGAKEHFLWVHPNSKVSDGYCHSNWGANPFMCGDTEHTFDVCGWQKVSKRKRRLLTPEEEADLCGIGICLSPDYGGDIHTVNFLKYCSQHNINILDFEGNTDNHEIVYEIYDEHTEIYGFEQLERYGYILG